MKKGGKGLILTEDECVEVTVKETTRVEENNKGIISLVGTLLMSRLFSS